MAALFKQSKRNAPVQDGLPMAHLCIAGRTVRFIKQIAEGGFSFVYLVQDVSSNEQFALKRILLQDDGHRRRVQLEIKLQGMFAQHPNIVKLFGFELLERGPGRPYARMDILMEYIGGGHMVQRMSDFFERRGHIPEGEVVDVACQIGEALQALHTAPKPIIHRDIKVENVLLISRGIDKFLYKLCDFGSATDEVIVAKDGDEVPELQEEIDSNTTLQYRAPEMVDLYSFQPITTKADVWAFGVMLYRICFFVTPFETSGKLAICAGQYEMPDNGVYSEFLRGLIKSLLVTDPDKRPHISTVLNSLYEKRGLPTRHPSPDAQLPQLTTWTPDTTPEHSPVTKTRQAKLDPTPPKTLTKTKVCTPVVPRVEALIDFEDVPVSKAQPPVRQQYVPVQQVHSAPTPGGWHTAEPTQATPFTCTPPLSPVHTDCFNSTPNAKLHKKWVRKALSEATCWAPKAKYVRKIVVESWELHGVPKDIGLELKNALLDAKLCKPALVVLWKLAREGHTSCMTTLSSWRQDLVQIQVKVKVGGSSAGPMNMLINLLLKRLDLHKAYPQFEGNFSLESCVLHLKKLNKQIKLEEPGSPINSAAMCSIVAVCNAAIDLGMACLDDREDDRMMLAPNCVRDAWDSFTAAAGIFAKLSKSCDPTVLGAASVALMPLKSVHKRLLSWFDTCRVSSKLTSFIDIPVVPSDSPTISKPLNLDMPRSQRPGTLTVMVQKTVSLTDVLANPPKNLSESEDSESQSEYSEDDSQVADDAFPSTNADLFGGAVGAEPQAPTQPQAQPVSARGRANQEDLFDAFPSTNADLFGGAVRAEPQVPTQPQAQPVSARGRANQEDLFDAFPSTNADLFGGFSAAPSNAPTVQPLRQSYGSVQQYPATADLLGFGFDDNAKPHQPNPPRTSGAPRPKENSPNPNKVAASGNSAFLSQFSWT